MSDPLPRTSTMTEPFSELLVHTAQGEIEAQLVRALLESAAIPCRTQGESLRLTHMFTVDGLGEVRFYVPSEYVEQARELLAASESGGLALAEGEIPGEGTPREKWKDLP